MSFADIKELTVSDLRSKEAELKKELMKARFAISTGQSKKSHLLKEIKRNIARIKTLTTQKLMES